MTFFKISAFILCYFITRIGFSTAQEHLNPAPSEDSPSEIVIAEQELP